MTEFKITLSEADTNRLFAIKLLQGKEDQTGNEFAAQMLSAALFRLFPGDPEFTDSGKLKNPEKYTGKQF